MIINSIPDLSLQYDEALGLLRVEWVAGQDTRTFRNSAKQLLHLAYRLGVRRILFEMNTFADISVYDQVWLGTNWGPGVLTLPLEHMILIVSHMRVHNQLAVDSLIAMARPFIKFDIQFFATADEGLRWLSDNSDRLPALLAEWNLLHEPELRCPIRRVA